MGVECDTCREALSARLDGEPEGVPAEQVDTHLATCALCQTWHAEASALTRTLRVRAATPVPDLTAAILDAAPPITPPTPRSWPRILLGCVAIAQLALGMGQVAGSWTAAMHVGHAMGVGGGHLFNESTAWNLAVGLGLLWTALRPDATSGMLPVVAAFLAVLIPYSASDLLSGTVTASRVLSHLILVIGLALLVLVHFGNRGPSGQTPLQHSDSGDTTGNASSAPEPAEQPSGRRRVRLRPVSRRRAA